ncbi:NADH-quinone oxidoreductase subunit L [Paenibacillus sp. N1-5-1-14]|uniref:NADH-quinone oxidoreductase subunit L n=1 Tax=Paenibacillus radicibacter TaxID=2972488 RepID=UPI002159A85E|nr:NADH-quinone oxidoreductase subunit L [Paenibacillus radicibacter]MCR8645080.1 NADH-quinone oxidoreductase subunit L [Paenibacillus radicibacter]
MASVYSQYAWLIPLFPLLAFLVLMAVGRQLKGLGSYIGIIAMLASFVLAILIFVERIDGKVADYTWSEWQWLSIGDFNIHMGFEITNLNALMLVIVTFVALLVNIYSKGYMKGDERISVFFSYVALFTFSMLGLVISVNLLELYIFWELVGVCSFLLIGFWYQKPEARAAAKKAFIITRIGDVGLLIGLLLLFWYMPGHALDFSSIHNAFASGNGSIPAGVTTAIAIMIFIGAIGKSGQFPLHTWLPDAMEGPTPISALIHAATMVAAGVYLVARTYDIFLASPDALLVVAYVGGFTAIFAATIGIAQNDIKRVLAYSTVSQLGYMMMGLGIGVSYASGMFHLFTHAFFKALLFLAAGSVIHAVKTQDIREMGGLSGKMKITTITFAIGALALSGVPPFSGFWSKDTILNEAYHNNQLLFWIGIVAAFFTALYMSRVFFLVFTGKKRSNYEPHESPASMTLPLIVLAVLAVVAGFVMTPFNPWLGGFLTGEHHEEAVNLVVIILSVAVGLLGIVVGYVLYYKRPVQLPNAEKKPSALYNLLQRKYYIDEIYDWIIVTPLKGFGWLLQLFDEYVVDGLVRLTTSSVVGLGRIGSRLQNGQVQRYGLVSLIGLIILMLALVARRFFPW